MTLTPEDAKVFKEWLTEILRAQEATVVFTKKDGTERSMTCTLCNDLIPPAPVIEDTRDPALVKVLEDMPKKERKINENTLAVYATDVKAWRSFRWDSVKSVSLSIGDETNVQ